MPGPAIGLGTAIEDATKGEEAGLNELLVAGGSDKTIDVLLKNGINDMAGLAGWGLVY